MPQPAPNLADANGPPGGAFYVGARVAASSTEHLPDAIERPCARCGAEVRVDAADIALAESCAAVMCSHCSGTAEGIMYIAP